MSWYNPWSKSPVIEEKSVVIGLNDELSKFLMFGRENGASASSAISLYEKSTAASIPINWISDLFSSIIPVIEVDGEIIRQHPVLDLLSTPSPYFSRELFFEVISRDYLVTNEFYLVGLGGTKRPPLELQPISPKYIDVPQGNSGLPSVIYVGDQSLTGNYYPEKMGREIRYYNGDFLEIKQVRGFSTRNNSLLRGQSLLCQASAEVRQHILGSTHNTSLLENGGRLSLIFHFDQHLQNKEFEEAKQRVHDNYGGANNAGKIGVTAGGKLSIHEAGTSNRDMDFSTLQKMAKEACALQYKFPLPLLTVEASTMNNYKESKLALYDDAVLPLANTIFAGLTRFLMPRFGLDPAKVKITYDIDHITALASRRIDELVKRKSLNIETDNELRSMIGKEDYSGGDVKYQAANLVPLGTNTLSDDPEIIDDDE